MYLTKEELERKKALMSLTPSQRLVYDAIVWHKTENNGNSPGREEVMEHARMKSRSQYTKIIKKLEKVGLIEITPPGRRNILVVGSEWVPPRRLI
jgi:DNA-binding MarR family transcriptional regulator